MGFKILQAEITGGQEQILDIFSPKILTNDYSTAQ
jgi:hypothetical protein